MDVHVSLYQPHMLIFVATDCRDATRRYGYGIRGKPPRTCKLLERVSVISAMNENGIAALRIVRGTVDGDVILEFIERELLPTPLTVSIQIEECFSKVKAMLKRMETTCLDDIESDILAAFSYITPS